MGVNLPLGAAAFAFGLLFLQQQKQDRPGRFDLAGFLLSGLGLGLLMYGVSEGPTWAGKNRRCSPPSQPGSYCWPRWWSSS